MNNFQLLTLGFQRTKEKMQEGSLVHKLESFTDVRKIAATVTDKKRLPAIYPFFGRRGNAYFSVVSEGDNMPRIEELVALYKDRYDCTKMKGYEVRARAVEYYGTQHLHGGSNVVCVDLDTTLFTKDVMENADKLNELCNNSLIFIQPSFSGKLHLLVNIRMVYDINEYKKEAAIVTVWVCEAIAHITGKDPFTVTDDKGRCCVDPQNITPSIGLYFPDNDYIEYTDFWQFEITDEQRKKVCEKAGVKFEKVFADPIENAPVEPFVGEFTVSNPHRLKVDRNYFVGGYSGNAVRMQYANVMWYYSKGNFEKYNKLRRELFLNWNEFTPVGNKQPSPMFKAAFDAEFGILSATSAQGAKTYGAKETEDGIMMKDGEWLTDYKGVIVDTLNTCRRLEIIAPTGTGKTVLINQLAKEGKCLVCFPYNSQQRLYNGLNLLVAGEKQTVNTSSATGVWDQCVKHIPKITEDYTLILDEVHLLFSERSYREKAQQMVDAVKNFGGKVLMFTATDTMEGDLFNPQVILRFQRHRKIIGIKWMDSRKPYDLIRQLITKDRKCCVFSDSLAQKLYWDAVANSGGRKCITMLHSDFKFERGNNQSEVFNKEILTRPLTIATKYAYSGNNFNNDEPIRVIITVGEFADYSYIVQALGRFRRCEDLEVYVVNNISSHAYHYACERKNTMDEIGRLALVSSVAAKISDRNEDTYLNVDAESEIERYYSTVSKETIIDRLCATTYISVEDLGEIEAVEKPKDNRFKRSRSNALIDTLLADGVTLESAVQIADSDDRFTRGWKRRLRTLSCDIAPITIMRYIALRTVGSSVMLDSVLTELEEAVDCADIREEERGLIVADPAGYAAKLTKGCTSLTREVMSRKIKRYAVLLNAFEVKSNGKEMESAPADDFALLLCDTADAEKVALKQSWVESGKRRAEKIRIRWVGSDCIEDATINGYELDDSGCIEFGSKGMCMAALCVSSKQFAKFVKGEACGLSKLWKIVKPQDAA